jgi:undecaprenyl-diphosphatase
MYDIDVAVTRWINGLSGHDAGIDGLVMLASTIGVPLMVLAVAVQWWSGSDRRRTRHVLIAAGLSFLIGLGINQVILLFVHRLRPYDAGLTHLLIAPTTDFSFPSDHATASVAVAATFLLHGLRVRGSMFLAAACLIAFTRVYLGTHYASDVLGGALTALLASVCVCLFYRSGTRLDRLATGLF